jgi:hypothetical protein
MSRSVLNFDELNMENQSYYARYFAPMKISEVQKSRRIRYAIACENLMLEELSYAESMNNLGAFNIMTFKARLELDYLMLNALLYTDKKQITQSDAYEHVTAYAKRRASNFASEVAVTTFNHLPKDLPFSDKKSVDGQNTTLHGDSKLISDNYYTGIDRAITIAQTESNVMNGYYDYEEAVAGGAKYKTWITTIDGKQRDWHDEANGQTVPIDEPFEVDGELLMEPCDDSLGASAENIVNCRCSVEYH